MSISALVERIWRGATHDILAILIGASVCHHGEPVAASGTSLKSDFGPGADDAAACRDALLDLLLPGPVEAPPPLRPQAKEASHWIPGLVTLADWLRPHLRPTGAVYRDHGVLWCTAREIERRGRLTVPDDVRDLVEAVHWPAMDDCPE